MADTKISAATATTPPLASDMLPLARSGDTTARKVLLSELATLVLAQISSAWDGAHLVLGSYHVWVDSTGQLRIKSSAPSSDTDGLRVNATYLERVLSIQPASLIGYWPLSEESGSVATDYSGQANHGAYTAVTLGQPGIGDGRTAASFDGSTSKVAVNAISGEFNGAEGSLAIWGKVSAAGVWTDGISGRLANLLADTSNRVYITKSSTANVVECVYIAGGTAEAINIALSTTDWFQICITWSKSNNRFRAYLNGAQSGIDVAIDGTWAGTLSATETLLGARATNSNVFSGLLAHAFALDRELSAAEVAQVFF